jgi:hypothetical protein
LCTAFHTNRGTMLCWNYIQEPCISQSGDHYAQYRLAERHVAHSTTTAMAPHVLARWTDLAKCPNTIYSRSLLPSHQPQSRRVHVEALPPEPISQTSQRLRMVSYDANKRRTSRTLQESKVLDDPRCAGRGIRWLQLCRLPIPDAKDSYRASKECMNNVVLMLSRGCPGWARANSCVADRA